jgi:hypothetical protein
MAINTNVTPATYMDAIATYHPTVKATSAGSGNDYDYLETVPDVGSDPLPPKATLDAEVLTMNRERMWRAIQAERDRRQANGVKVGDNWFHSDNTSRIQQIALVIFGANLPTGIMWKTLNGAFVPMTNQLAVQIFQYSAAQDVAIFTVAEQHKAAMLALANPLEYDFSGGWPPTYTGSILL